MANVTTIFIFDEYSSHFAPFVLIPFLSFHLSKAKIVLVVGLLRTIINEVRVKRNDILSYPIF